MVYVIATRSYAFEDKAAAREHFTKMTGLFKNLNYAAPRSKDEERLKGEIEFRFRQGRVHLGANSGLAMRHDREEEAGDIDALVEQPSRHVLREFRVTQHHRNDGVFTRQQLEHDRSVSELAPNAPERRGEYAAVV